MNYNSAIKTRKKKKEKIKKSQDLDDRNRGVWWRHRHPEVHGFCVYGGGGGGQQAGQLLSLAGSTWQVDSVSRSLDPLPRLRLERVEGLDCRRLSLSRQPRTPLERKTRRRAEEERIFGFVAEGFFFHPLRGWAIECVCRGRDR